MKSYDIKELFANVNGTTFVGISTMTDVKLKGGQKNELQGKVKKVVRGSNVMVFQNKTGSGYGKMVERRLEREGKVGTFELQPRKWGTRIENTPFIENKGQLYLEVIFLNAGEVKYMVDGEYMDDASHVPGFPAPKPEADQGGLDNKVIIRTYKVESLVEIKINGETYIPMLNDKTRYCKI